MFRIPDFWSAWTRSLARLFKHGDSRPRRSRRSEFERLDRRELFAADFRSYDGTGNNLANVEWGSTDEAFLRKAPAAYADGVSTPSGADRLGARDISNLLAAHGADPTADERGLSAFAYAWGQFLDHDLDLTLSSATAGFMPIAVPRGDATFDPSGAGGVTLAFNRSTFDPATGAVSARQQVNRISAFIDGSMVYGSSKATSDSLRTFVGGKLKTSDGDLPPQQNGMFVAGDIRVNENPELVSMHALFVREHNRIATDLAARNPNWDDERIFQETRRVVVGEIQAITYKEFLPALLGRNALRPYTGYKADVNPGISNEFATAAFRLGHSMLEDDIEFLANDGSETREPVELKDAFFNTAVVRETGIDPILKYLASTNSERIDTRVVDGVRNFLMTTPGGPGFDLAAFNIQRGRDHGLVDYNSLRAAYGLAKATSFSQITRDTATQEALRQAYGSVDKIDAWVGGLAEDHVPGSSVGALFQRILTDQFTRLRDGDRFWYQRDLQGPALANVERTTLADVIRRNTTTTNLQDNVFFFRTSISGRVFGDANGDGRQNGPERGIAGAVVTLLAADGSIVATTRTRGDGTYRFEDVGLGKFRVSVAPPTGQAVTREVELTRGQAIDGVNLATAVPTPPRPRPNNPLNPPPRPRR